MVCLYTTNTNSLGPLIGGAFASTAAGWRWAFYFNVILVGVTLPMFLFVLPSSDPALSRVTFSERIRHLDLVGSILFAGALCSGMMAISFGGILFPWGSARIIGLFCCSGTLWILFGLQQETATFTTKQNQILPIHVLLSTEIWILVLQTACPISIMYITIYYIPLYFQFVQDKTAIRSAVGSLPFLITTVAAMLLSGRLLRSSGRYYKLWFIVGSAMALIMSVGLYTTKVYTSPGKIYAYLIVGGIGVGSYAMNAGPVMSMAVQQEDVHHTGTIFGSVDNICSAISVGIANSIFLNRAIYGIQRVLPGLSRSTIQSAIAGVGSSITNNLPSSQRNMILQAILEAIKDAWIQIITTAGLSFTLSLLMRNRTLS